MTAGGTEKKTSEDCLQRIISCIESPPQNIVRRKIAIAAMKAMLSNPALAFPDMAVKGVAAKAYQMADAMLEYERKEMEGPNDQPAT